MGCGVALRFLVLLALTYSSNGKSIDRKTDIAYVADPVGNVLSKPSSVPQRVGSPSQLAQPDRYEFYTFDETGELIKRLMTLDEIQEIIATGDGDDGHLLTIAHTDLSKPSSSSPAYTVVKQPPSHVKVHSIVNSVQNVLKAEIEAQKANPPAKPGMLDTPDVSDSWSMILPAIFGNTGGNIAPDTLMTAHVEPETDVIGLNLEKQGEEALPVKDVVDEDELLDDLAEETTTRKPTVATTTKSPVKSTTASKPTKLSTVAVRSTTTTTTTTTRPPSTPGRVKPSTTQKVSTSRPQQINVKVSTTPKPVSSTLKSQTQKEAVKTTASPVNAQKKPVVSPQNLSTHKPIVASTTTSSTVPPPPPPPPRKPEVEDKPEVELNLGEIINQIAGDLQNPTTTSKYFEEKSSVIANETNVSILTNVPLLESPVVLSSEKPLPPVIQKNATKDIEKTTEKLIESTTTGSTVKSITESVIEETSSFIKILPIVKDNQRVTEKTPEKVQSTTTERLEVKTEPTKEENASNESDDDKSDETDDYLELVTEESIEEYADVTKPEVEELSGSITDLISQIVDDSRPTTISVGDLSTTINENKLSTTAPKVTDPPKQEISTESTSTVKFESQPPKAATASTTVKAIPSTTMRPKTTLAPVETSTTKSKVTATTSKPSPVTAPATTASSQYLVKIPASTTAKPNKISDKTSVGETIAPTTYRPPLPVKITTQPSTTTTEKIVISTEPEKVVEKTTEKITTTQQPTTSAPVTKATNRPTVEASSTIRIEQSTTRRPTSTASTTVYRPDEESFESDYDITTGTTVGEEDAELMEMLNQVSQIFQIAPKLESKSDDLDEDEIILQNSKATAYKKNDAVVNELEKPELEVRTSVKSDEMVLEQLQPKINKVPEKNITIVETSEMLDTRKNASVPETPKVESKVEEKLTNAAVSEKPSERIEAIDKIQDPPKSESNAEIKLIPVVLEKNEPKKPEEDIAIVTSQPITKKTEEIKSSDQVTETPARVTKPDSDTLVKVELEHKNVTTKKEADSKINGEKNSEGKSELVKEEEKTEKPSSQDISSVKVSTSAEKITVSSEKYISSTTENNLPKEVVKDVSSERPKISASTEKVVVSSEKYVSSTTEKNIVKEVEDTSEPNETKLETSPSKDDSNDTVTWKLVSTIVSKNNSNTHVSINAPSRPAQQKIQYSAPDLSDAESLDKNEPQGLEVTTAHLGADVREFAQLCNELAIRYWESVSADVPDSKRSLVTSPFAVVSLLSMLFLGARGATSEEMNEILRLDDTVTFNPHAVFKNITESIVASPHGGVATSAFVRELFSDKSRGRLIGFYKERAHQFYGGHVEEINFANVGDVVRRRTNLLVKRQTAGKIPEYIKANNMVMRPPLSIFSANIFQTDCTLASTDGRDGEMYFAVAPTIRQRRLVPVPAVLYRGGFLAGYAPELDATVAALGSPSDAVSTIFAMPGQRGGAAPGDDVLRLQRRIAESASDPNADWMRPLLRALRQRRGLELQLPRFSHRSVENGTRALRRVGLRDLFDPARADLRGLNGGLNGDLHLADVQLVNTMTVCGERPVAGGERHHVEAYPGEPKAQRRLWRTRGRPPVVPVENDDADVNVDDVVEVDDEPRDYQRAFNDPLHDNNYLSMPLHLRPRQARLPEGDPQQQQPARPPRLKFDRPFMFFVRHNPTGVVLYMGRYNPRLLP